MEFRVATLEDVSGVADLMSALDPDEPWDPVLWRHNRETWAMTGFPARSHLLERDGEVAAFAEWWFHPPPPGERRFGSLRVAARGADSAVFRSGLELVESEVVALGVDALASSLRENEVFRPRELRAAGYRPDRLDRWWELDLAAGRDRLERMAGASRERMRREGVDVTTIAAAEPGDADLMRKLYDVDVLATRDVPTTVPHVSPPYEAWLHHLRSPALHRDRMWIALDRGAVLGMSWLRYPVLCGNVHTGWTGVSPTARGRGIARALKLETVLQALSLRVELVRTENDEENAPILHLNADLGYRPIPGERLWVKD